MEKRYVQHVSGEGKIFEVLEEKRPHWMTDEYAVLPDQWLVRLSTTGAASHLLPKSDYQLCGPPLEWRDVTGALTEGRIKGNFMYKDEEAVAVNRDYRLKKIQGKDLSLYRWAFIVEKREP